MAMSFAVLACVFGTIFVFGWVVVFVVRPALARRLLNRWTSERGLALHETARLWVGSSAFQFCFLDTRAFFRIRVTDAAGEVRTGVARAGYRWLNCLSPRVDVVWDEAPRRRTTG